MSAMYVLGVTAIEFGPIKVGEHIVQRTLTIRSRWGDVVLDLSSNYTHDTTEQMAVAQIMLPHELAEAKQERAEEAAATGGAS